MYAWVMTCENISETEVELVLYEWELVNLDKENEGINEKVTTYIHYYDNNGKFIKEDIQ